MRCITHILSPNLLFPTEGWHQIAISAKSKLHIAELQQLLTEVSSIPTLHQSDIIVTNVRHFEALTQRWKLYIGYKKV